eukprot:1388192-Heterocapsa_arctica.AAC.1
MASMPALERKELSRMGAVRLSREQAINFVHSCLSTQYIYTLMIACNMDGQEDCLGYILYQDLGNKPYAAASIKCIKNTDALWLKESKKGDL